MRLGVHNQNRCDNRKVLLEKLAQVAPAVEAARRRHRAPVELVRQSASLTHAESSSSAAADEPIKHEGAPGLLGGCAGPQPGPQPSVTTARCPDDGGWPNPRRGRPRVGSSLNPELLPPGPPRLGDGPGGSALAWKLPRRWHRPWRPRAARPPRRGRGGAKPCPAGGTPDVPPRTAGAPPPPPPILVPRFWGSFLVDRSRRNEWRPPGFDRKGQH